MGGKGDMAEWFSLQEVSAYDYSCGVITAESNPWVNIVVYPGSLEPDPSWLGRSTH